MSGRSVPCTIATGDQYVYGKRIPEKGAVGYSKTARRNISKEGDHRPCLPMLKKFAKLDHRAQLS